MWAVKIEFCLKHPTRLFFSSQRCRDRTRQYHRSHHSLVSTLYTLLYVFFLFLSYFFVFSWFFICPNQFYTEFLPNYLFFHGLSRQYINHMSQYKFNFYGHYNNPPALNIFKHIFHIFSHIFVFFSPQYFVFHPIKSTLHRIFHFFQLFCDLS